MTEFNGTPGPWLQCKPEREEIRGSNVTVTAIEAADGEICLVHGGGDKDFAANAQLIAAAPDLLEACQAIADNWESGDLTHAARLCSRAVKRALGLTALLLACLFAGCRTPEVVKVEASGPYPEVAVNITVWR